MKNEFESTVGAPRFQFVRELGKGVLGEAHEVLDEATGDPVVLKLFARCRPKYPDAFKLEFEGLARVQHESLVRLYHLIDPKSDTNLTLEARLGSTALAFTEEYVEGCNLFDYLAQVPSSDEHETLEARRQQTGEVPSAEVPSTELPLTGDLPISGEVEISGDTPSVEVVGESGLVSASEDFEVRTDELVLSTREVPLDGASPDEVVREFMRDREQGRELDVVFLRLEHIVPQVASGLEYLHRFGKVHGNLRPSNILVTLEGDVKLTDFGIIPSLVYVRDDADCSEIPLLQAPENLPFLPPEAIDDGATPSGDLYALGCVLFEAISGRSPHDVMEMLDGKLAVPPLAELVPECPASWASVVDGLLTRVASKRPSLRRIVEVVTGNEARPVVVPPSAIAHPDSFVGREHVVEGLKQHAETCANEKQLRLLLLDGQSGIGKTQILGSVSHWLSRRGWLVLRGRCYNREAVAYQGWQEIADQLAMIVDGLPAGVLEEIRPYREQVGRILPQLAPSTDIPQGTGRLGAIDGLRRILGRISAQRPILLYLQDLQWASWDTSALLVDLFSRTDGIRCLVVGTWQDDVKRSQGHLLDRDLDLALLDLTRIRIRGYSHEEATQFAKLSGLKLNPVHVSAVLQQKWLNPLLLRELRHDHTDIDAAVEALTEGLGDRKPSVRALLKSVYASRFADVGRRDMTLLNLLAVASGPLPTLILHEAAETELASAVLPQEGTESAIDEALESLRGLRLVRSVGDDAISLAQEVLREQLLEQLGDRDQARLSGRIADAYAVKVPARHDLRFEYALRSGRVAVALESAVDAAEEAEARFAYHRAAKLWRWLLEKESELPEYSMIKPAFELARVEHLAGQHAQAAELYSRWADEEGSTSAIPDIRLHEASAWIQAGEAAKAVVALERAFEGVGESYASGIMARVADLPAKFVTASSRWSNAGGETPSVGDVSAEVLQKARLYYFAADTNRWLDSECGAHFEARLARLAEKLGHARILGMSRLKTAEYQSADGDAKMRTRCLEWIEDAHRFFELSESADWVAQSWFHEGLIRYRFADYEASYQALRRAADCSRQAEESGGFDARRNLHWTAWAAIRTGRIDEAMATARRILHVYRGDHLATLLAYEVMTHVELLRGNLDRAEQFLDASKDTMNWHPRSHGRAALLGMRAQLHIARGRPEVAVGQLDWLLEVPENRDLFKIRTVRLKMLTCLGQALVAQGDRERALQELGFKHTMARLKKIRRDLTRAVTSLNPEHAAEMFRLFACIELLAEAPKRALKEAERAIEVMSKVADPVSVAKCTEVRGRVLVQLERPEGRVCLDQAAQMYQQIGCAFPLVLEGWAATNEHSWLKMD